jgi:cytochrome c-type biogenesis protein CcmF
MDSHAFIKYVLWPSADVICFCFCVFVTVTILQEFIRGTRVRQTHTKLDFFTSLVGLVARGKRRYGGYLVHLAIVLMFVGFAGGTYKREAEATLEQGKSVALGPFQVRFAGIQRTADPQKEMTTATLEITRDGSPYVTMHPAKWAFRHHEDEPPTSEVDIKKTLAGDLYVVLNGYELEPQPLANIKVVINPLVNWIWLGFLLLAAGTVIAYMPDRAYALAARQVPKDASKAAVVGSLLLMLLVPAVAAAQNADQPMARALDPALARNDRERELFKKIVCQCGTCGRQVLSECTCGTAADMRRAVQKLIDQGKSDDGVIEYELATYPGQSALVVPIDKGFNRLAWILPFAATLAGVGALVVFARKTSRKPSVPKPTSATTPLSDEDQAMQERLADELDELD